MPGAAELRAAEDQALSNPTGFYSGSGKTPKANAKISGKKKSIAGLVLAGLVFGGTIFLSSSHTLLPAALNSIFPSITQFDNASHATRQEILIASASSGQRVSGWNETYYKFSNWLSSRFSSASDNITVEGDTIYFKGENVSGENFITASNNNPELRSITDKATQGRVANYYDEPINTTIEKMTGNNRNVLQNLPASTGNNETDIKSYDDILTNYYSNKGNVKLSSSSYSEDEKTVLVENENGNGKHQETITTIERNEPVTETRGTVDDAAQAKTEAESAITGVSKSVGRIVNFGCTALMLGSSITSAISGLTTAIYFNKYLVTMEPISKMMAGSGDTSGINVLMDKMTTKYETTANDPTNVHVTGEVTGSFTGTTADSSDTQDDFGITIGTYDKDGSMVDSPNMQAALTQSTYDEHAAARHSVEASSKVLLGALATFGVSRAVCVKAQAALAAAKLGETVITATLAIGTSIISGGTITVAGAVLWPALKNILLQIGIGTILNFTLTSVMGFAVPMLAKLLTNHAKDDLGVPGGEELVASAAAFGSYTSRQDSGLSLASEAKVTEYSKVYNDVLAKQAEVDRINRSPFDITSRNTFLGSIAYKLFAVGISKSSSVVKTIMQTTSSSIASITQSVYAETVDQGQTEYMNTFGECEVLRQIGAEGDIYCNPIVISDVSTLNIDPNDQTYVDKINSQLEQKSDGTWAVKSDGDLAKYIAFCVDRRSPFGEPDASILDQLTKGNVVINALPFVGDINQILDDFHYQENEAWANGASCVASADNPYWDTDYKYYQRYVEDQRILNQLHSYDNADGTSTTDPVTAFREEYRKNHPVDNSPAGYLASISGTNTETAQLILDMVTYYNFLKDYDPSTRIAMNEKPYLEQSSEEIVAIVKAEKTHFDHQDTPTQLTLISHHIIYADVRNRSYAV